MDEEKKTGLADAVKTGASAAHTIKGAIKAGKAISGAAKGAAAGGPYGAVAGAVWSGRKHIGKIIAVIIILLLLPVLFILMLPGLIFGGLVIFPSKRSRTASSTPKTTGMSRWSRWFLSTLCSAAQESSAISSTLLCRI